MPPFVARVRCTADYTEVLRNILQSGPRELRFNGLVSAAKKRRVLVSLPRRGKSTTSAQFTYSAAQLCQPYTQINKRKKKKRLAHKYAAQLRCFVFSFSRNLFFPIIFG